jgi:hypothetical protein
MQNSGETGDKSSHFFRRGTSAAAYCGALRVESLERVSLAKS